MTVAAEKKLRLRINHEMIEIGENIHAMWVYVLEADTGAFVWRDCWLWHLNDEDPTSYCKMVISSRLIEESLPLKVTGAIMCSECGLSGSITDGRWHARKR